MAEDRKRKAAEGEGQRNKKAKTKKSWHTGSAKAVERSIKPGDAGIWVTCHKGKERKCIGEFGDLLAEHTKGKDDTTTDDVGTSADDIEKDIQSEIAEIKRPSVDSPVTAVWTDTPCLVFFRTSAPLDPVRLTRELIENAAREPSRKRTRCTQRLTPSSLLGFASEEGLEKVAKQVLAPYFHTEPVVAKKFAIRPTIRNHNILQRNVVIDKVASIVGPGHSVDLKNFDLLILVDIVKNVCGIAVVGPEYEALKRFNLQEIYEPTPLQGRDEAF